MLLYPSRLFNASHIRLEAATVPLAQQQRQRQVSGYLEETDGTPFTVLRA